MHREREREICVISQVCIFICAFQSLIKFTQHSESGFFFYGFYWEKERERILTFKIKIGKNMEKIMVQSENEYII